MSFVDVRDCAAMHVAALEKPEAAGRYICVAGTATERYRLMCNALGGAVEPYSAQLDYNVEALCDSVLAVDN